jgi:hypothetical protein
MTKTPPARTFEPAAGRPSERAGAPYVTHAILPAAPLAVGERLSMPGRIKMGRWLPFGADQEIDDRSFV